MSQLTKMMTVKNDDCVQGHELGIAALVACCSGRPAAHNTAPSKSGLMQKQLEKKSQHKQDTKHSKHAYSAGSNSLFCYMSSCSVVSQAKRLGLG